jgi:hypothetical protein
MIKVTVRAQEFDKETKQWGEVKIVKVHENGLHASVYNGVLTIFNDLEKSEIKSSIAGYMPDRWLDWEKV